MMRKYFYLLAVCAMCWACSDKTSNPPVSEANADSKEVVYDSLLAKELGADQYGMKSYVMVFLKKGPNRSQDSTTAAQLQKAHLDNITKLAEEGKLVLAGPFFGTGDLRGIYLFDVPTIEEAQQLTETDPAIKAGSLIMEMHQWYGSAAIMKVDELHRKIAKIYI